MPTIDAQTRRAHERLMAEVERIAQIGSWTWDLQTGIRFWSDNLYRLLGYEPQAFPPSTERFHENVHPDDQARLRKRTAEASEGSVLQPVEFRVVRTDGVTRWLLAQASEVHDASGTPIKLVGTLADFTDRRSRESEIRRTKDMLEDAQNIARVGSWSWLPASDEIAWSDELYRITGLPIGTTVNVETVESLIHPDDLPELHRAREQMLATGAIEPHRTRLRRRDGSVRVVEMRARVIPGEETSLVGVVHDITELEALEQQLSWSRTMEAAGRLAAGIAHDFNNLLTVIMTNAIELGAEQDSDKVDEIISAADSGAELVRRLLEFGGRSPSKPRIIDLTATVRDATRWVERVIGDDVTVISNLHDGPLPIQADPAQLHQVLLNLAVNARDAMPDGGTIRLATRVEAGIRVALEVVDEGCGMSEETLERAIDPFFTTKKRGEGSGLGLSMVKRVITDLGGELFLSSRSGEGTTVRIHLPLQAEPAQMDHESQAPPPQPIRSLTVLLVEDDPAVRRATQRILTRSGYNVLAASDPEEAEAIAGSAKLDLVLTDFAMVGGGGPRVAEMAQRKHPGVPILFMTGYAPDVALGFEVLPKPFRPDQLLAAISHLVASGTPTP